MQLPQRLRGADADDLLNYVIERVKQRTRFDPGKRYKLNIREPHSQEALDRLRDTHPWLFGDSGLLKRTEHWTPYNPIQYIRIPRKENASRVQTTLEDLRTKEDFFEYFTSTFPDLQDGVYGAMQRKGRGNGMATLFVLELKDSKVATWKQKSNGSNSTSSRYYAFPLYFKLRNDLGV